ncbi:MAG: tryptophan 7-halogenase [Sphingomonadales bacterium]|nr:tryptophan 7-halogenase [Sphingomonadales bacterium]
MDGSVDQVVIVGGGTAGWLAACLLGARRPDLSVTLVESPDVPTIGVGEGTWPTMRETLATIGIAEDLFLGECDAAFKQGSRFDGWVDGAPGDSYLHPFTAPPPLDMRELLPAWQERAPDLPFAAAMTAQHAVCARDLAPRQRQMPDYAGALNYGYHLDAGKFAALLMRHATGRLGVTRIAAHVVATEPAPDGTIAAVRLGDGTRLAGDLFLDCSGQAAILIGGACGSGWVDRSDVSVNDRALAVQVPVTPDSPIAAQTIGTAHEAGWLWDIGLPTRRGIGCVYSSRFLSDERAAEILSGYVARAVPGADPAGLAPRQLRFATGHRERFWVGNCLAVGLSAGFIEPLEASAIVLIELSLKALIDNFPRSRATLPIHAERFNALFRYRWDRIVEFLKLHYALSRRPEPYWQAQRAAAAIPPRLADCLTLWREQPPSAWDFPQVDELFPAASHQYVLYGMGFPVPPRGRAAGPDHAAAALAEVAGRARALTAALPANRTYLGPPAAPAASLPHPHEALTR